MKGSDKASSGIRCEILETFTQFYRKLEALYRQPEIKDGGFQRSSRKSEVTGRALYTKICVSSDQVHLLERAERSRHLATFELR
jgi:hypothetical protein